MYSKNNALVVGGVISEPHLPTNRIDATSSMSLL